MDLFSNSIEREHWATISSSSARRLGQFWTPYEVARLMAAWLAPTAGPICDPAAGSGVFLRALADPARPTAAGREVINYDIDRRMLARIESFAGELAGTSVATRAMDYFASPADVRYGGIITNPPYLNHALIDDKQRLSAEVERTTGLRPHGLSNLYVYFLLRLAGQLAPGGRLAAIVPAEFLDSSHGRPAKRFLLERNLLRGIISFDSASSIFDGAQTTAAVLLLSNDALPSAPVCFLRCDDTTPLASIETELASPNPVLGFGRRMAPDELDPDISWRRYFEPASEAQHGYLPLSRFADVRHGVTTGCNQFFVLRPSAVRALSLPLRWLKPTVGRSRLVAGRIFRPDDWQALHNADEPVWLLDAPEGAADDPVFAAYGRSAIGGAARRRPSIAARQQWHRLPRREPAPLWISNLSRGRVKLVRNESSALTLDQFHGVYPRPSTLPLLELLGAWWQTEEARASVRAGAREYGGGLLKAETAEMAAVLVPDFSSLSPATVAVICSAEAAFRAARGEAQEALALAGIESAFAAARGELHGERSPAPSPLDVHVAGTRAGVASSEVLINAMGAPDPAEAAAARGSTCCVRCVMASCGGERARNRTLP